ncbi:MAG: helix-turn-helix domain-containing protein [Chitinophagaceae bacterium]|nr:helix-turn-helix domain-containing protein [Oligoflexus sp.]
MIGQQETDSNSAGKASHGPTFYELLDVPTSAARLQIREAYIRIKHTYASGSQALYSLVSDDEAQQMMERAEEAYRVLDDELLRKEYDVRMGIEREVRVNNHEFGALSASDIAQTKARRTLKENDDDDLALWNNSANTEPSRPRTRLTNSFTKIKKVAAHAFDADVLELVKAIQAEPLLFDGKSLVQLREAIGVTQNEVQERTKVSLEYIKGLENNDFHKLPSLVYIRGFTKIYLQYLGIKECESLVEAYTEKYNLWREQSKTQPS